MFNVCGSPSVYCTCTVTCSVLRNKSELQTTIRSLKDTNATLQALNRELEEKLFTVCVSLVSYTALSTAHVTACSTADGGQSTTGQGSGASSSNAN